MNLSSQFISNFLALIQFDRLIAFSLKFQCLLLQMYGFLHKVRQYFDQSLMLNEVLVDYLERFSNIMTESVYASKGIQDYSRMKRYCDYLDYDKETLFRDKGKSEAGLRNIGNTCYLNVILQLLFHVNYLRQKIFNSEQHKSQLIQLFRELFGEMAIGKLTFADPSDLFDYLKSNSSDIFIPGVQNDFHEIFTLLIDKMSESYKETSPEEAKFISKILFGKMMTKIDFLEGKTSKAATFNIINLDVAEGSFEKSFQKWKNYKIDGYETPKGNKVDAIAENIFVQTPALMTFFINRVGFKNNKLQKDTRVFEFEQSILVHKAQQSQKTKQVKNKNVEVEGNLLQEKTNLIQWIEKIQKQRDNLTETLKYLRTKETPLLSEPHIENQLGEAALNATTLYIQKQIQRIDVKVDEVNKEVKAIEERLKKLQEEGNYETYLLWAVMIHEGSSAIHGHYKVCIKINESWFEYNDRIVKNIPSSRIDEYKNRGEICCLFYRRPSLICDSQRLPITHSLKTLVGHQEKMTKIQIDKARLLQCLYQETESANILLEHEIHFGIHDKFQFFFKPVHYAITEKFPNETCKGILIMESISCTSFKNSLANKLISEDSDLTFQRLKFGIPDEYFAVSEILKNFLNKEAFIIELPGAYEELSSKRFKFTSRLIKEKYFEILQIIILKGLYYLHTLSEHYLIEPSEFNKLSTSIDKLLESMDQSSEFTLVCITIKSSIRMKGYDPKTSKSIIKGMTIDNYGAYFNENFRYWINQRSVFSKLDESNFYKNAPVLAAIKES